MRRRSRLIAVPLACSACRLRRRRTSDSDRPAAAPRAVGQCAQSRRSSTGRCRRSPAARSSTRSRRWPRARAIRSKDLKVKMLRRATGETVKKGDFVKANYLGQIWNGKEFDNSCDAQAAARLPARPGQGHRGLGRGPVGKKVGSRVEMVVPPTWGYGKQGNRQAGIKANATLVFVVDIAGHVQRRTSSAKGAEVAQAQHRAARRSSTNTDGKAPTITMPEGATRRRSSSRTTSSRATARRSQDERRRPRAVHGHAVGRRQGVRLLVQHGSS